MLGFATREPVRAIFRESGYDGDRRRNGALCYILCIAVPKGLPGLQRYFGGEVSLDPLSDEPLALATIDGHPEREAFALTMNGCSCDVLVGGHRVAGKPELVTAGLAKLLDEAAAVAILNHWFTQPIADAGVTCKSERRTSLKEFKKLYPKLEEDLRYIIEK